RGEPQQGGDAVSVRTEVATGRRQAGRPAGARPGAAPVRGRPGVRPGPRPAPPRAAPPRPAPAGPPQTPVSVPRRRTVTAAAGLARSSRTPFVFLVVGLLGGGLLCLLLINTILDTGSYQISQLQQQNVTLVQRNQELQAQIAHEESPAVLASRAHRLGLREPSLLHLLHPRESPIAPQPPHLPGAPAVPWYP